MKLLDLEHCEKVRENQALTSLVGGDMPLPLFTPKKISIVAGIWGTAETQLWLTSQVRIYGWSA